MRKQADIMIGSEKNEAYEDEVFPIARNKPVDHVKGFHPQEDSVGSDTTTVFGDIRGRISFGDRFEKKLSLRGSIHPQFRERNSTMMGACIQKELTKTERDHHVWRISIQYTKIV